MTARKNRIKRNQRKKRKDFGPWPFDSPWAPDLLKFQLRRLRPDLQVTGQFIKPLQAVMDALGPMPGPMFRGKP